MKRINDIVLATLNDDVIGVLLYLIKIGSVNNYVYQRKVLFVEALGGFPGPYILIMLMKNLAKMDC